MTQDYFDRQTVPSHLLEPLERERCIVRWAVDQARPVITYTGRPVWGPFRSESDPRHVAQTETGPEHSISWQSMPANSLTNFSEVTGMHAPTVPEWHSEPGASIIGSREPT